LLIGKAIHLAHKTTLSVEIVGVDLGWSPGTAQQVAQFSLPLLRREGGEISITSTSPLRIFYASCQR
jgi:hypothetical protein